jgi:Phosphodiester glycosidase
MTLSPSPSSKATPPLRPAKVVVSRFRAPDGSVVTLATFRGPLTYRLHSGSQDPGHAALSVVRAGPAVTGGERRRLLAAFNGGFLLSASAGGYEQEDHVISPLIRGLASLVIDRSGSAQIGSWGHGLPRSGEPVTSVRQNLRLLVRHGRVSAAAANWGAWGATLGGGEDVARSALGQDAAGQLIFAGSMSASPAALAQALVHAGARSAMELDINPEWVQLDVARKPGHWLRAAIPGQVRPAGQYLAGWTRDFITVLAPR